MTTAFVLSGGASLGSLQVGMLRALHERGVRADLLVGTSVGAVNAAWLAGHPDSPVADLAQIWRSLRRGDVFPAEPLHGLFGFMGRRRGLEPPQRLLALIEEHLTFDRLEDAPVPLHVVVTDVLSTADVALSAGPAAAAVLASASIPGVLPPVEIEGRYFMDGGVVNNTPISHAVRLGADEIWVLPTGWSCSLAEPPRGALAWPCTASTPWCTSASPTRSSTRRATASTCESCHRHAPSPPPLPTSPPEPTSSKPPMTLPGRGSNTPATTSAPSRSFARTTTPSGHRVPREPEESIPMSAYDYDLIIVGAGSGNMLPDDSMDDWRIAVVETDRFGGTCLNRGCIPSKMFVHTADVARTIHDAARFGIDAEIRGVDWPAVRDRVFGRIDPIHDKAVDYRRRSGIDVHLGEARFVDQKTLDVEGTVLRGKRFVLAVGTRPRLPDIAGIDDVEVHTSDTIMRLDRLPASMLVIGGGFIAAEMSHVFGSLGTDITIVHRGDQLLQNNDHDIRDRFTRAYDDRFSLLLDSRIDRLQQTRRGIEATVTRGDGSIVQVAAEVVLAATGRVPNSDRLDVAATGLDVDEHGHVQTDATYQTNVDGIWAVGDVANHFQLKHMANAETRLVRHNIVHPESPRSETFGIVPAAVTATREYSATAYGWALEDTASMVKILADPDTRLLLGAHIIGPDASILIQPLIQAMCLANTVDEVAKAVLYIHPALTEVVEQALLDL